VSDEVVTSGYRAQNIFCYALLTENIFFFKEYSCYTMASFKIGNHIPIHKEDEMLPLLSESY
jgi:hypothetical protein